MSRFSDIVRYDLSVLKHRVEHIPILVAEAYECEDILIYFKVDMPQTQCVS